MDDMSELKQRLFPVDPRAPMAEQAYRTLQAEIVTLGFKPGGLLKEPEIRERFGFGRTPIREAMLRLSVDGLVVMHARHGTFVSETNIKDLGAVYETRQPLEGLAASLAARRLNDAGRKRLGEGRALLAEEASDPSIVHGLEVDHRLHELIYDLAGNDVLRQVLVRLLNLSFRLHLDAAQRAPIPVFGEVASAMLEFGRLLDAIEEQRADDAAALALRHTEASRRILSVGA